MGIFSTYFDPISLTDIERAIVAQLPEEHVVPRHVHGSHSQGNIIFQDISRTKLPFSRIRYTEFKGNKSSYVQKTYI